MGGKGLETWINNSRINSCETATALVASAAEATGYDSQRACAKLAVTMGMESDMNSAMRGMLGQPDVLASARSSSDPNVAAQAPFVGNLVWQALKTIDTLDDASRELVMSIVGTTVFYPPEAARDPASIGPSITTVAHLLYGQSDAGGGNINIQVLKCDEYVQCLNVTRKNDYVHEPLVKKVEDLMRSISDNIKTRTAIPNNSTAVGFVNSTSIPVWRMLSWQHNPWLGLSETLIATYKEVIAADYAFTFLNQFGSLALTVLQKKREHSRRNWSTPEI